MTPYFVKVVVEPSYQTLEEDGRDCNPDSDSYASKWFCEADEVITVCGICVLIAAIAGLPLWKLAVAIGLSVVAIVMSISRLVAAYKLLSLANSGELTGYIIAQVILH